MEHNMNFKVLGSLSERYESGGRGCGTVSGGQGDPGGISYGLYQLASKTGTVAAFLKVEGAQWAAELCATPGSPAFSAAWKAIAAREAPEFSAAQHAFIERSHYRPAVAGAQKASGHDLDARPDAVRNAAWSTAVQHGGAVRLLTRAVAVADAVASRGTTAHDRATLEAIYHLRAAYVRSIAEKSSPAVRRTLMNVVEHRYPDELDAAKAMLAEEA